MIIDFILNMILIFTLISLFNLIRYIFKVKKIIKMHKGNPNIQGISIINGQVKVIEKDQLAKEFPVALPKKLVTDLICHKELEEKECYRVVRDGKEYFFCSWECRETFLSSIRDKKEDDL